MSGRTHARVVLSVEVDTDALIADYGCNIGALPVNRYQRETALRMYLRDLIVAEADTLPFNLDAIVALRVTGT
jgi:hypothetical protein